MEDNEIPAAGEMLKKALDQNSEEHVNELSLVIAKIIMAAGRGGKFTSIDFKSELDRIIRAYQESNKDA